MKIIFFILCILLSQKSFADNNYNKFREIFKNQIINRMPNPHLDEKYFVYDNEQKIKESIELIRRINTKNINIINK
jgi:hypothetical protein